MNVIHVLLIIVHTIAGVISFISGLLVIKLKRTGLLFESYLWMMVLMMATLITVLTWDWSVLSVPTLIIYAVMCLLAMYSVFRGFTARQKQIHRYTGWWLEFMDDVGFTVISLFDILVIVGAIDLALPLWAIILIAFASIFIGRQWLQYEKQHYIARRAERKAKKLSGEG